MRILSKIKSTLKARKFRKKIEKYEKIHKSPEPKERPKRVELEDAFDNFVKEFGGEKLSEKMENKARLPSNADYIFRKHNVIAELKSIEGVFSGETAIKSLFQAFSDADLDHETLIGVVFRREKIPEKALSLIRLRIRRGLEERIKHARKQLKKSKSMFGNKNTFCLILISIEQNPIFGQKMMLSELARLMASNFSDEHVDGIVYLNPNTPIKFFQEGMEYGGWYPMYRDEDVNRDLSEFVNALGAEWLTYYSELIGENNPILEIESIEEIVPFFR